MQEYLDWLMSPEVEESKAVSKAIEIRDTTEKNNIIHDYSQGRYDQYHSEFRENLTNEIVEEDAEDHYNETYIEDGQY